MPLTITQTNSGPRFVVTFKRPSAGLGRSTVALPLDWVLNLQRISGVSCDELRVAIKQAAEELRDIDICGPLVRAVQALTEEKLAMTPKRRS